MMIEDVIFYLSNKEFGVKYLGNFPSIISLTEILNNYIYVLN